jgi:RNA polymerase sigma-70 factor (ECF subfamily)
VPLDADAAETAYVAEAGWSASPEVIFERRWALTLVERALARVEQEMADEGRGGHFAALKPALTGERGAATYAELAGRLGTTEAALKMTVLRLRRRFGAVLREEVAQTVVDPAEVDDELRHMLKVLSESGSG